MSSYRRPLWLYPLFQIPLICLGLCLITALLFWLLGFGKPKVAVAIALDISGSTYNSRIELFNSPGTVLNQEIKAVEAYLEQKQWGSATSSQSGQSSGVCWLSKTPH